MRKVYLALAGATALTAASTANAAITIGTTGTTSGSAFAVTGIDNVGVPKTVDFKTTTDAAGSTQAFSISRTLRPVFITSR